MARESNSRLRPSREAEFVDLDDGALLDLLGYLHEEVKNIDERMKADEHIERVEAELKEYKDNNYLNDKRATVLRLKAVRMLAKARGLKFIPPKSKNEDA